MKKQTLLLMAVISLIIALIAFSTVIITKSYSNTNEHIDANIESSRFIVSDRTKLDKRYEAYVYYCIDKETGVEYMITPGGVCVMVDKEGNPKIHKE